MTCHITITWDPEAGLWAAVSRDLPDLALEDPSLDALRERAREIALSRPPQNSQESPDQVCFHYDGPNCR